MSLNLFLRYTLKLHTAWLLSYVNINLMFIVASQLLKWMKRINSETELKVRKKSSLSYKLNPLRIFCLERSQIYTHNNQGNWLVFRACATE